jgi:hypothetical protein
MYIKTVYSVYGYGAPFLVVNQTNLNDITEGIWECINGYINWIAPK